MNSTNENQIGKLSGFLETTLILIHYKSSHIMNDLDGYKVTICNFIRRSTTCNISNCFFNEENIV